MYIPHKNLTEQEINNAIKRSEEAHTIPNISIDITMGEPLYQTLWMLCATANLLVKDYLKQQPEKDCLLKIFYEHATKYQGRTLLAFATHLGELPNLTQEKIYEVTQVFFERALAAINEELGKQE